MNTQKPLAKLALFKKKSVNALFSYEQVFQQKKTAFIKQIKAVFQSKHEFST